MNNSQGSRCQHMTDKDKIIFGIVIVCVALGIKFYWFQWGIQFDKVRRTWRPYTNSGPKEW